MSAHTFHLEKLLNLRTMEEQSAALELASKSAKLQELEVKLFELKAQLSKTYATIGKENLIKAQLKMAEIQSKIQNLANSVVIFEKEKSAAHQNYLNALKNRKILENLKNKSLT